MVVLGSSIGKYEIVEEIGFGGMGTVFRARDAILDRDVALKTMTSAFDPNEENHRRFLREARSIARLQHRNIVTVYEFGEHDGRPFIAMELLRGQDLNDLVAAGGLDDLLDKLWIVEQLCCGLAYAHGRGVIHRDIKPSNVFITEDRQVKLLDFGVAWLEGGAAVTTDKGVVLGTPHYMAPEMFLPGPVDYRIDMWATGVILYELLAGRRPFEGSSVPSMITKILHREVPPLDPEALSIPASLVEVVHRALAKRPEDRYDTMESMARAVEGVRQARSAPLSERLDDITRAMNLVLDDGPGGGDTVSVADTTPGQQDLRPPTVTPTPTSPGWQHPRTPAETLGRPATTPRGVYVDGGVFGERQGLQLVAVSPDERVVAVGGIDGSVRVWELETRVKLETLRSRTHLRTGHAARTTALAFSPDGGHLATGHLDGAIYVWDAATGLEAETVLRHEGAVGGLAFADDGSALISGSRDGTLKVWEMEAVLGGEARRQLRRQPAGVTCLAAAGGRVFSGHENRVIRVQDLAGGRLLATLHGHHAAPTVLAVAPAGNRLASGTRDCSVRVFDLENRQQIQALQGHARSVCSVAWFADGERVASAAMENQLVVWSVTTGLPVATLTGEAEESFASVAVLAGGHRLLCGLADGRIRCWLLA